MAADLLKTNSIQKVKKIQYTEGQKQAKWTNLIMHLIWAFQIHFLAFTRFGESLEELHFTMFSSSTSLLFILSLTQEILVLEFWYMEEYTIYTTHEGGIARVYCEEEKICNKDDLGITFLLFCCDSCYLSRSAAVLPGLAIAFLFQYLKKTVSETALEKQKNFEHSFSGHIQKGLEEKKEGMYTVVYSIARDRDAAAVLVQLTDAVVLYMFHILVYMEAAHFEFSFMYSASTFVHD
ncbi:hypothetical protein ACJX0J_018257 [Zea mays]